MLIQLVCITALYIAAAVLPVLGLARALRPIRTAEKLRAQSGLPADDNVTRVVDMTAMLTDLHPRARRRAFRIDMAIVSLGLACGAAASIWALWLFA